MSGIPQPLFPDDDGKALPSVVAALGDDDQTLIDAIRGTRVFVAVVAQLLSRAADGSEKESEMALALIAREDKQVLPVFTSIDCLNGWRNDARPVQVLAEAAALQAVQDDMLGILIDSQRLLTGRALRALIFDFPLVPVHADPVVEQCLSSAISMHEVVVTAWLAPSDEVDAVVNLLIPIRDHDQAPAIARAVAQWLADDPVVRLRTEKGFDVQVVTAR